jgi:hypothetical protein
MASTGDAGEDAGKENGDFRDRLPGEPVGLAVLARREREREDRDQDQCSVAGDVL